MKPKFDFYEIVRIKVDPQIPSQLHNEEGVVMGMAEDEKGLWGYAVAMPIDNNLCWDFSEKQLEKTGKFKKRSDFYDGSTLKVIVDPETGEGKLKEEL